jgi:hypothetical protein
VAKKRGFHAGAWDAFSFMGFTAEVSKLVMAQRIKESEYKKLGYDTWEECCNEQFRCSDETMSKKLKALKDAGPQALSVCRELGFEWQEIRLFSMSDQKENLKEGFLLIEDKKIPIKQENAEIIKLYAGNLEKAERLAKSKVEGIDKEHRKELKAHQEEIERLQSLLPKDEDDREWAENFIEEINKAHEHFDDCLRVFAFHKKVFGDPVIQAKVIGIHEQMKARYDQFVRDFDAMLEDGE